MVSVFSFVLLDQTNQGVLYRLRGWRKTHRCFGGRSGERSSWSWAWNLKTLLRLLFARLCVAGLLSYLRFQKFLESLASFTSLKRIITYAKVSLLLSSFSKEVSAFSTFCYSFLSEAEGNLHFERGYYGKKSSQTFKRRLTIASMNQTFPRIEAMLIILKFLLGITFLLVLSSSVSKEAS